MGPRPAGPRFGEPRIAEPGRPRGSPVLTVVLTSIAYFMVALDTLAVITALPSIHRDLGGSAALICPRLRLPESYGTRSRLDIPALALISAGVGVLIWGLVQGPQDGWGSTPILAALLLGAVLIAAFLAWDARAPEPMIPLRLFRAASFSAAVGTQFLMSATIFSATFLTSQFFQLARGDSPLAAGLRFLPLTATPLLVAPAAGALSDRVGARPLVIPGLLMQRRGSRGWPGWPGPRLVTGATCCRS